MSPQKVNILLVEDNPNHAELTTRALKMHNLAENFVWVKTGEEALDFVFARGMYEDRNIVNTPKVIFLDLKLPKKSGLDVLRELRADERTKYIPVVMISTSREEKDVVEGQRLGLNGYIVKPDRRNRKRTYPTGIGTGTFRKSVRPES
ncbi:MAG: response regulator [Ignavibacteriales bacterium]|nr:response regulator [Ignavibacteriales bacterium]